MSELFGVARAAFEIVGELVDKREVTSTKETAKDWRLYLVKIETTGSTIEVEVSKEDFDRAVIDQPYMVSGKLKQDGKFVKLVAQKIEAVRTRSAVGSRAAV